MAADSNWSSRLDVHNPYDGSVLERLPLHTRRDAEAAISKASGALSRRNYLTRQQRSDILFEAARRLDADRDSFAALITRESGKVIRQSRKEARRAVSTLKMAAAEALGLRGEELPVDAFSANRNATGYYSREPVGVIVGITPFNDPLNLAVHKVAPALAAGAPIIVKPSELAPLSAIRLRQLLLESGMPAAMCQVLTGDANLGQCLTRHPQVRMISFTGGEGTADAIVRAAGVKRYSFDLGGNAPVIVTDSADLEAAVSGCLSGAFWANGHNCISVQRILVADSVFEAFVERFLDGVRALKLGDPAQEQTDLGPVISDAQSERLQDIIQQSCDLDPSSLRFGGNASGRLIQPTVFVDPNPRAPCLVDEVFGPIVSIQRYTRIEQAVCMANATETALNAGLYCQDIGLAHWLARALQFGAVMINESSDFRFDNMPFGGAKRGGVGREGVRFAMEEMTQPKVQVTFSTHARQFEHNGAV